MEYICSKCKISKSEDEFFIDGRNKIRGRMYRCKTCCFKYKTPISEESKIKQYEYNKNKRLNNPELIKKYYKKHYDNWKDDARLLVRAKKNAVRRNLEFNIEKSDIITSEYCPLLEVKLVRGTKYDFEYTPSIDRIDSSKGYIKGNVQVMSMKANNMKNNATIDELIIFSKNIILQNKNHKVIKDLLEQLTQRDKQK